MKLKLTWQEGAGNRKGRCYGRYHDGRRFYFAGGKGKSDRAAYAAAMEQWRAKKVELDNSAPSNQEFKEAIERRERLARLYLLEGESDQQRGVSKRNLPS